MPGRTASDYRQLAAEERVLADDENLPHLKAVHASAEHSWLAMAAMLEARERREY